MTAVFRQQRHSLHRSCQRIYHFRRQHICHQPGYHGVIGRFEEQFRIVGQSFDRAQFFTHDGLDEFIGELAFFDDTDELAVIGNRSDIAFVGCEPFGSIFQAGADRKGFDFRVDSFADFDVEVLDQRAGERRGNNSGQRPFPYSVRQRGLA